MVYGIMKIKAVKSLDRRLDLLEAAGLGDPVPLDVAGGADALHDRIFSCHRHGWSPEVPRQ